MAYFHYQITVPLLASNGDQVLSANTSGNKGNWFAGPNSYYVKRVAIQQTSTAAWATGAKFSFRKVTGGGTAVSGGQFAVITRATGGRRRDGMSFNDGFSSTKIPAGYGIVVAVTTKATGKLFRAFAIIEPSTERLQNLGTGVFLSVTA